MRPPILNDLFASVTVLKGIASKVEKLLVRLLKPHNEAAGVRLRELLFHLPSGLIDRRTRPPVTGLPREGIVTVKVTVGRHLAPPRHNKRIPYKVECFDDTGNITLVFFHSHGEYLQRLLPVGEVRFVSGAIAWFNDMPQISHPDHVVSEKEFETLALLEPVYPLTGGLPGKLISRAVRETLQRTPDFEEWQDAAWLAKKKWPSFKQAITGVHIPVSAEILDARSPARERLAYDEFLANQLALALVRRHMKRLSGRAIAGDGRLRTRLIASLEYTLTGAQKAACDDILRDMAAGERMLRLLQGDVGSGKTIVALVALICAVEAGAQGALMVPTEILARQHLATIAPLLEPLGVNVAILTGRDKGQARQSTLDDLASGRTNILIGTHALFQDGVDFKDLALVVIDEQHRFGVHQRLALQAKASDVTDLLVMTATPIPRTLTLTLYGDMDVSRLTEKPAGRKPVITRVMAMDKLDAVLDGLGRAIAEGNQVYWVCPLVEDSDLVSLTSAQDRHAAINARFAGLSGLVHGRMKGPEKDAVMARFRNGDIKILVATTVIEVGVDIPRASIMVIENAGHFGLAQLHQLRGRVGRGQKQSSCLLLYQAPIGQMAAARLKIMRETQDGFIIAEEDLRLRGSGELLGVRQSGVPEFRLANPVEHADLLSAARDDSDLIINRDPDLKSARGQQLRVLLYLFERNEAIRLLASG